MDTWGFNSNVHEYWIRAWAWNSFSNWAQIKSESEQNTDFFDQLPSVGGRVPALIIGSGPSLDQAMPLLHKWMGAVFCSPSHVKILDHWGRAPEFILSLDCSDSQFDKLQGPLHNKSTLIVHPSVSPKILSWWKWSKRYFLTQENNEEWAGTILPAAYPWIVNRVVNAGCSANVQTLLAYAMGYDPIFTIGVDFGFPGNQESCTQYELRTTYAYLPKAPPFIDPKGRTITGSHYIYENGVVTTSTNKFYKTIALGNWFGYKYRWFDCSSGIISEVPKVDFAKVIENQVIDEKAGRVTIKGLPQYPKPKEIEKMAWEYLEPLGVLPIVRNGRMLGIEFADRAHADKKKHSELVGVHDQLAGKWVKKDDGSWALVNPPESSPPGK